MLHQRERLVSVLKQFLTFLLLDTLLLDGVSFYPIVRHQLFIMYIHVHIEWVYSKGTFFIHTAVRVPHRRTPCYLDQMETHLDYKTREISFIYFYQGIDTCLVLKFMGREGICLLAYFVLK